jgi:hypothetical protein
MTIEDMPRAIIKSKLAEKKMNVSELIEELKKLDEDLTEQSFNNKMYRGTFSAIFFFKCMVALNVKDIRLLDI